MESELAGPLDGNLNPRRIVGKAVSGFMADLLKQKNPLRM